MYNYRVLNHREVVNVHAEHLEFEVRRDRTEGKGRSEASGLYSSHVAFDRCLASTRQVEHDVRGISIDKH